jgi:uncharacterized protein (DUF1499 family)
MLTFLKYAVLLLVVAVVGLLAYVRFAPLDAATWHVDPVTAPTPATPNSWRIAAPGQDPGAAGQMSAVYRASPAELMAAFQKVALSQPHTELLSGSAEEGFVTFVQRTPLVRYPDYISVRAVDLGDGTSALSVLSRSRFGKSDMGVNKARMEAWLAALAPLEVAAGG